MLGTQEADGCRVMRAMLTLRHGHAVGVGLQRLDLLAAVGDALVLGAGHHRGGGVEQLRHESSGRRRIVVGAGLASRTCACGDGPR